MSFAAEIKREIARDMPEKECCAMAELGALTQCLGSISLQGAGQMQVIYRSFSTTAGKRLLTLLRYYGQLDAASSVVKDPRFGGRFVTTITLTPADSRRLLRRLDVLRRDETGEDVFQGVPKRVVRRICCRRAFLRGMFLGCGTLSAPDKGYHAEFLVGDNARARFVQRVLEMCDIPSAITQRKGEAAVYIKDSGMIARLLATLGASRAMLEVEEMRTRGAVKQQVNRALNCDHANLEKQVASSRRQVDMITRISHLAGLTSLPRDLEALARLRLLHPEATLEQLGVMLSPPISKSGVQHRMRRLSQVSANLRTHTPSVSKEDDP